MNIIDNHSLLNLQQVDLLHKSVSLPFRMEKFQSLDDILTTLKVDVIIEPGIIKRQRPSYLDEAEKFWREEVDRLKRTRKDESNPYINCSAMDEYCNALNKLEEIQGEKNVWSSMTLRGLYDPKQNVIKLYPEEMAQEDGGTRMDELLVSTLAHETMHAYFNRPRHKSFPYVLFVEEPLAEFGMLLYLHEAVNNYYKWAYQDVSDKKTCYRYGAKLMDQHLNEGQNSSVRKYLEAYKIRLDNYAMPTMNSNGLLSLPQKGACNNSPIWAGQTIIPHWQDVFKYPPRYFYDPRTQTLGLDGDWSEGYQIIPCGIYIMIHINAEDHNPISQIYLGDNFIINYRPRFAMLFSKYEYEVVVSPANKQFYERKGVPFYKKDNTPMLHSCGDGLFELCRNGKWGVVDAQLNQVVPFVYDCVWSFDKNDLIMVKLDSLYGLVNRFGREQVPVIYKDITENNDGTYTVKQNGREFRIDKYGDKI